MIIRLLGGLLFLTACGKQVNIDHTALEEASKLQSTSYKDGIISKPSRSSPCIQHNGSCYTISDYSSHSAKGFIAEASNGTHVKFIGYIQNSNCIVEKVSLNGKCLNISEIYRK